MAKSLGSPEEIAQTIKRLYERGLVSGVGGNASVIVRPKEQVLITPAGFFKGGVASGDIVKVNLDGKVSGGGTPSSELPTHLLAYRLRGDICAIVHAHPPAAVGLVTAGLQIPVMTPEHAVMVRRLETVDFATPGAAGAAAVAESLKVCDVVGVRNHGFFSLGKDLHEAASRLEVLEESARVYLAGKLAGGVTGLTEVEQKRIRGAYGRE
ncbi:MAG: class II aldolase/adducin family protein [Nitrososphaerota archaeon]|nr:class II aldolase/adducin family protein [Nitrososphaerota archaeon]